MMRERERARSLLVTDDVRRRTERSTDRFVRDELHALLLATPRRQ